MASLVERDLAVLWHPASHFVDHQRLPPVPVDHAEGAWLTTADGQRILDAISSWWTSVHGHGHPAIVEAITKQARRLDHVMLAGFTHEPAVALAEQLLAIAGPTYGRVFFADCGSAAVEIALKMSWQGRHQRNESGRTRFAALRNGYHGETLGALAVSGSDDYRRMFSPLLPDVTFLPAPALTEHAHRDLAGDAGADSPEADAAVAILGEHAAELTALVIEPICQCAGRMTMTGAGYYRRVVECAQQHGIDVIADEIAVAFGRTGKLLGSQWAGVTPDFLCLSKGLSGGVLPLSAVVIRAAFERDFGDDPARSFMHSHTFTGNPIACAAGLASLRLLPERLSTLPSTIADLENALHWVAANTPAIAAVRQAGMIGALELRPSRALLARHGGRLSLAIREAGLARGVLLRPLHDVVYWMPPLCITAAEIQHLAEATSAAIAEVAA